MLVYVRWACRTPSNIGIRGNGGSAKSHRGPSDTHCDLMCPQAWVNGGVSNAADVYHNQVPAIYEQLANHYSIPSVNLIPALTALPRSLRDLIFRDDCHHTHVGAAFVASIIAASLEKCLSTSDQYQNQPQSPESGISGGGITKLVLPPVIDTKHWVGGQGA
jgi:hypothetical protein